MQDGRDVPDGTSVKFVEQLEKDLEALEGCDAKIASGGGRMHVTMDRYEVTGACTTISVPVTVPAKAACMNRGAFEGSPSPRQAPAMSQLWGPSEAAARRRQACKRSGVRMQADWKIVERGWHAHVLGEAEHKFATALEAVKKLRVRHTVSLSGPLLITSCSRGP